MPSFSSSERNPLCLFLILHLNDLVEEKKGQVGMMMYQVQPLKQTFMEMQKTDRKFKGQEIETINNYYFCGKRIELVIHFISFHVIYVFQQNGQNHSFRQPSACRILKYELCMILANGSKTLPHRSKIFVRCFIHAQFKEWNSVKILRFISHH